MSFKEWRKAKRMTILKIVFALILFNFWLAYQAGTSGNPILVALSLILATIAVALILLVKK